MNDRRWMVFILIFFAYALLENQPQAKMKLITGGSYALPMAFREKSLPQAPDGVTSNYQLFRNGQAALIQLASNSSGDCSTVAMSPFRRSLPFYAEATARKPLAEPMVAAKSKGRAFLYSLVLPGLGERYVGARRTSEFFMGTELTLWLGYFGFLTYSDWRSEDYRNFAAAHAGIDPRGKPYDFFVNIGSYDNIDAYNAAVLRDRNLPRYYRDTAAYYWQWDSIAHRQRYERIRKSAARADNRATLMVGAIFANHLISAIDAVWAVHKHNRSLIGAIDWHLRFGDGFRQPTVLLSLQKQW